MVVGVCRLKLYFPESRSLKNKRHYLRRITDRLRAKFNVAAAEVGHQDSWQQAAVGFAVVSNRGDHVNSMVDNITRFVSDLYLGQIIDRQFELLHYNEETQLGGDL